MTSCPSNPALLAWLAIFLGAPVQWSVALWYLGYWDLFPKYSLKRLIAWLLTVVILPGTVLVQYHVYRSILAAVCRSDVIFYSVTIVENTASISLLFYMLHRRRTKKR